MALKKLAPTVKHIPIIIHNHNREAPKEAKTKTSRVGKMRAKGKSVAEQIHSNLKARTMVLGRTLRGVRKV